MRTVLLLAALSACSSSARFTVEGDTARMNGVIGSATPARVAALIADHPEVRTLVLEDVPGSINDVANIEASRAVRAAGLSTRVPSDGIIASGGVDFFCAGVTRSAESGAALGVHSWASGDTEGRDVDSGDDQHALYLDYYAEMGIPADFYWFTLGAADADGIHWMSETEIATYGLVTE